MAARFAHGVWLLGALAVFALTVGNAQARPKAAPQLITLGPGKIAGAALDPARQVRNRALRQDALRAYLSRRTLAKGTLSEVESLGRPWVAIRLGTVTIGPPPNADPCSAGLCPNPVGLADDLQMADSIVSPSKTVPTAPTSATGSKVCACVFLIQSPQGGWVEIGTTLIAPPNAFTAPPGAAPWQVEIERPSRVPAVATPLNWRNRLYCGGTLIAPQWVLTAAHCLTDGQAGVGDIAKGGYRVRLGVDDISSAAGGVSYAIVAAIAHPGYDAATYYNDIALLRIAPDARTAPGATTWIQSLSLDAEPAGTERFTAADSFLYGWGLNERQEPSARLQIAVLRVQPDNACGRADIALCALGVGARPSAQCHGDSGGPLVAFLPSRPPLLIGVVSHNSGHTACGSNGRPGVFTRVAAFHSWIAQHTGALPATAPPQR